MVKQKDVFLEGEADAWFDRNHDSLGLYDPITPLIKELGLRPERVLEVGCANGWRLAKLRELLGCSVIGIDPSMKAGMDAARYRVPTYQMTASCLPVSNANVDMLIYGFCLYLTDPDDWLLIAAEGDRVLNDGGHIIIHDFNDWVGGSPMVKVYDHQPTLRSYHYGFEKLWLAHPRYISVAHRDGPHDDGVTVLRKRSIKDTIRVIK